MDSAKPAFTIKPTAAAVAAKAADANSRRNSGKEVGPTDMDSDDPTSKTTFTIKPMTSSTPKVDTLRGLKKIFKNYLCSSFNRENLGNNVIHKTYRSIMVTVANEVGKNSL